MGVGRKGSLRDVDGDIRAKSPPVGCPLCDESFLRRVGRSDALRMVGLALSAIAIASVGLMDDRWSDTSSCVRFLEFLVIKSPMFRNAPHHVTVEVSMLD
jgi:hypothetical protein